MAENHAIKFKGEALWAKLVEPDYKFNQTYGDFSVKIRVSEEDAEKYFDILDPLIEESRNQALKSISKPRLKETLEIAEPWKEELDDETGEFTGFYLFSFKQSAVIYSKKNQKEYPQRIAIYHGPAPSPKLEIGNGSTITVAFDTRPYYNAKDNVAGISLKLKGVLVHKLVEFQGTNLFGDDDFDASDFDEDVADAPVVEAPVPSEPAVKPRRTARATAPVPQEEPEPEAPKAQEAPVGTRAARTKRPVAAPVIDEDELPF
jgi:hypothetical protein